MAMLASEDMGQCSVFSVQCSVFGIQYSAPGLGSQRGRLSSIDSLLVAGHSQRMDSNSQALLAKEIKGAMLAKDADRLSTLRLLKSALGYAQLERKTENLSEADFAAIVQKEVEKRRDAIEQYEKGGRPELAAKEKKEIPVLEGFLDRKSVVE